MQYVTYPCISWTHSRGPLKPSSQEDATVAPPTQASTFGHAYTVSEALEFGGWLVGWRKKKRAEKGSKNDKYRE